MTLPTDYDARKAIPLASVADYFPDALCAVAHVIRAGQEQHGTTGWDRAKSRDEESTLLRHFLDRGAVDSDGVRHSAKMAWRALALLQKEIEAAAGLPISRGSYNSIKGQTGPGTPELIKMVICEEHGATGLECEECDKVARRAQAEPDEAPPGSISEAFERHETDRSPPPSARFMSSDENTAAVAERLLTNPNPGYSPRAG
jgi:hypothetical protein